MKDGRTHLAHKAEHGIDLETGAILSVTVQEASEGDSATLPATLTMAAEQVEAVQPDGAEVEEVVADKGYHSDATLVALDEIGVRSYVSEPERGRRCWQDKKTGETPAEKLPPQGVALHCGKSVWSRRRGTRGGGRRVRPCDSASRLSPAWSGPAAPSSKAELLAADRSHPTQLGSERSHAVD